MSPVPKIPAFRSSGQRRRDYSVEAILKLEAQGKVLVERNEQGEPTAAQFLPEPEKQYRPRIQTSIPTGTYYSFEEQVADTGYYVWTHKDLRRDAGKLVGQEAADMDLFLACLFRSVPLECMSPAPGTVPASRALAEAIRKGPAKERLERARRKQEKAALRKQARKQRRLERRAAKRQ